MSAMCSENEDLVGRLKKNNRTECLYLYYKFYSEVIIVASQLMSWTATSS